MGNNYLNIVRMLFKSLGIDYNRHYLEENLYSNPNFPSILSIVEILSKYKIDNVALKVDRHRLKEMPVPLIAELRDGPLVLIQSIGDEIEYKDENFGKKIISIEDFYKIWTGVILVTEKNKNSTEPNYVENRYKDVFLARIKLILVSSLLAIFIAIVRRTIFFEPYLVITLVSLVVIKLIGVISGAILVRKEFGYSNKILKAVCSTNKTFDCNKVLNSKYAKFFQGEVSLNALVFSYFLGSLSVLLIFLGNQEVTYFLSFLGFITIPIVLISLFYQFVILKKLCRICLIIQVLLLAEFAICIENDIFQITYTELDFIVPSFMFIFFVGILGYKWVKSFALINQEKFLLKRDVTKFRLNMNVFNSLLSDSRRINPPSETLGISFSNKEAKFNVLKVCNPYCSPCSDSHPVLEELYKKGLINLQIIFISSLNKDDERQHPIKHFLTIHKYNDEQTSLSVLTDWYLSEKKEYQDLAAKYPISPDLNEQENHIEEMLKWSTNEGIVHTPSLFIDGHELPSQYGLEDFKALLIENF